MRLHRVLRQPVRAVISAIFGVLVVVAMSVAVIPEAASAAGKYRACSAKVNQNVGKHRLAAWGSIAVRDGATCSTGVRLLSPLQKRMKTVMQRGDGWPRSVNARGYRCRYKGGTSAAGGGDGSADYRCSRGRRGIRIFMVF